jgi:3'-phosphoadenosine 5'-phosphosulfate sulfotransferase (PAPS reductase)/FAD synthetase
MKTDKPKMHIASCSFGKDSIATILIALEHNEPLDRAVFSEVMFDHSRNISGEIPEHIEWVYSTAIPRLEEMGIKVDVVKAEKDYLHFFTNAVGGVNGKATSTASPLVVCV